MIHEVHSLAGSLSPGLTEHHILSSLRIEPKIHPEKRNWSGEGSGNWSKEGKGTGLSGQARRSLGGGPQRSANISTRKREEAVLPEDGT